MSSPQDEIDALKARIAALTTRVYQLEQRTGAVPESGQQRIPQPRPSLPHPPPPGPGPAPSTFRPSGQLPPSQRQPFSPPLTPAAKEDANLERKIGQYWLNRIGIVAILFGVSYFLKFAFE